jgi:hypothetical protein
VLAGVARNVVAMTKDNVPDLMPPAERVVRRQASSNLPEMEVEAALPANALNFAPALSATGPK